MLFLMDSGQRPITVKLATKQTEKPSSYIKEAYLALRPLTLLILTIYLKNKTYSNTARAPPDGSATAKYISLKRDGVITWSNTGSGQTSYKRPPSILPSSLPPRSKHTH